MFILHTQVAIERKLWNEVFGLACHYAFMLTFVSVPTFLGAMIASGFMTAIITTVTHQGEVRVRAKFLDSPFLILVITLYFSRYMCLPIFPFPIICSFFFVSDVYF